MFTSRSEDTDKFIGVSSACDVLARSEWAFPWLPEVFGSAWDLARHEPNRPPRRRLPAPLAGRLYDAYVQKLRQPAPGPRPEEWQLLGNAVWEHANWLDKAAVEELLGNALSDEYVIGSLHREETIDYVMTTATAQWVAVVDESLEVRSVVDRWRLLDRALKRTTRPSVVSGP